MNQLLYFHKLVLREVEHSRALVRVAYPMQCSLSQEEPISPASAIFHFKGGYALGFSQRGSIPSGVRFWVADCAMSYTIDIVYLILQSKLLSEFQLS